MCDTVFLTLETSQMALSILDELWLHEQEGRLKASTIVSHRVHHLRAHQRAHLPHSPIQVAHTDEKDHFLVLAHVLLLPLILNVNSLGDRTDNAIATDAGDEAAET